MVIKDLKKEITSIIGENDARLLITAKLSMSITQYALAGNDTIDTESAEKLICDAKRIKAGEPLQYVTGITEFMSLPFKVKPGVLIPRPDTETLAELAVETVKDRNLSVLEIGVGSGCVSVSIAHYCKNASVTAIDISEQALQIAKNNAELNGVNVNFQHCDILKSHPCEKFDVIVSNPPYIPSYEIETLEKTVKDYEPRLALDGGSDGLDFYRHITKIAPSLLAPCGQLMYEVGYNQADDVAVLMKKDFKNIQIIKDLCGINRVVCGKI